MKKITGSLMMILIIMLSTIAVNAQKKKFQHDSNYYEKDPNKLTVRLYTSQKYIHLNLPSGGDISDLEYKANPKLNLGAGFTYRWITVNIFNGFGFLNNRKQEKGKTKGLDLQLQLFPKKWAINILAEFPKGFHLEPKGVAGAGANAYYYRPDIKANLYGIAAFRVPNKEKFSYKAAFQQTEWQKKSAGSFLFGGSAFHGYVKGDSAIIPAALANDYPEAGITKIDYSAFGPGAGYAHTFVVDKHFFFTGSLVVDALASFVNEQGIKKESKTSFNFGEEFKTAIGYNGPSWNVSATWTGHGHWLTGASTSEKYFFPSGNIRFVVAHKFNTHHHHS